METTTSKYNCGELVFSHGEVCVVYAVGEKNEYGRSYWLETAAKGEKWGKICDADIEPIELNEVNIKALGFEEKEPYRAFFRGNLMLRGKAGSGKFIVYAWEGRDVVTERFIGEHTIKLAEIEYFHELQRMLGDHKCKYSINYNFNSKNG